MGEKAVCVAVEHESSCGDVVQKLYWEKPEDIKGAEDEK